MHAPYVDDYTSHLVGAPPRAHWPLMLLLPVAATAAIAGTAFIFMIISMVF